MNANHLLENLHTAILLIDKSEQICSVNQAAETLFLQSRRALLGQGLEDLLATDNLERCFRECLANGRQFTLREVEIGMPAEDVLVDLTMSRVICDSENHYVLVELNSINRVSRFMREEQLLERQQSFRLMMRGLAHEIKNPLGGIRGAAQLLEREIEQAEHGELTDIIIREADRLTRLVDRVMGSRAVLQKTSCNIHELLENVIELVQFQSSAEMKISREYDPTLPEIELDSEQMVQAVLNIVANAIEAQSNTDDPQLGIITRFERLVTINRQTFRQVMKIMIWDGGPGVRAELRDVLFDPLVTGRADGSGLGLSITQEIVQRHSGMVQLEDYTGHTCFSIYLPYMNAGTLDAAEVKL